MQEDNAHEHDNRKSGFGIIICCPVYNDWDSALQLLGRIDRVVLENKIKADVFFVDDHSCDHLPDSFATGMHGVGRVEVLRLCRNLGHQRAIAIGLTFIALNRPCKDVVVMDADGEDSPDDIPRLLRGIGNMVGDYAVFAKRTKRSESLTFRFFYSLYKALHRLLTGRSVEVGNFSVISADCLNSLITSSSIWNHYAASVYQLKIPVVTIPAERSPRFAGQSKMNFTSLVTHGLSAIAVYSETVGVRLCISLFILSVLNVGFIGIVILIRVFTDLAIPGWATTAVGTLAIIFLQLMALSIVFVLFTLQSRNNLTFLPIRDFKHFISSVSDMKSK